MEVRINKTTLLAITLVLAGVCLRLIPHAANFAPVGAIALFAGVIFERRLSLWLPLLIMVISDLIIGLYGGIWFTWAAFALIVVYGWSLQHWHHWARIPAGALGATVIFFMVSNFGVWLAGHLYPLTWSGLVACYTMALPFARNTLLSDMGYSILLFSMYAYAAPKLKGHLTMAFKHLALSKGN